jgi:hypothetical protein
MDLNTIYQTLLNFPVIDIGYLVNAAFKVKEKIKMEKKMSDDSLSVRKSEGTTTAESFIVDDEIIFRLEQLYLKYKKNISLKDSKDLLTIIIKLKNNKK